MYIWCLGCPKPYVKHFITFFFFKLEEPLNRLFFIYLFIYLHWALVAAGRLLSCGSRAP